MEEAQADALSLVPTHAYAVLAVRFAYIFVYICISTYKHTYICK